MDVLSVCNITKSFRNDLSVAGFRVLHGVSFHAGAGEILGFLGPNGAGKTTTIKIILGLLRADSGTVALFDRPAGDISAMERLGYLPENPYFHPHLSLGEFLEFCGRMSGMNGKGLLRRISEVTDMVGMPKHSDQRLKNFSKGMLQRVGLAQAVLHDPDFLILDEPFSGLDPLGRKTVRDILFDLKRKGRTIFFSSHILPDMEALCDRACIIREGRIVRSVGLDELIRMGEGKVEVAARGCTRECLDAVEDYIEWKRAADSEVLVLVKEQKYVRPVIQHLYNSGVEVLRVARQHLSLEEVFLREMSGAYGDEKESELKRELTIAGF